MRERAEWRTALRMLAAMSGIGLASGRALALFFTQLGDAAWPGILLAAGLFGVLAGGMVWRGQPSGHSTESLERVCETMRLTLAALVSALMLFQIGETGALTLPLAYSYAFGAAFGLLTALAIRRLRASWVLGALILLYTGGFFALNAIDPRPVQVYTHTYTEFALTGNLPIALALATLYAALTACAGSWGLSKLDPGTVRPAGLGVRAGGLLCVLLCLASLALLRGGDVVIAHPLPWVVLSARWGLAGFWLCAGLKALCAVATLSAALDLLLQRLHTHSGALAVCMLINGAVVFGLLTWGRG